MAGDCFGAPCLDPSKNDAQSRSARKRQIQFAKTQLSKYQRGLYVMGNHDHYGGAIEDSAGLLRDFFAEHAPHVSLLDNEAAEIEGVTFMGTTLWARHGYGTGEDWRIGRAMNDFTWIRTRRPPVPALTGRDWRVFQPEDAYLEHQAALDFLGRTVKEIAGKPAVLLTHHAPSFQSGHGIEYGTPYLDDAYCANLVDFLLQRPNIKLAVHGHTHHPEHYRIGDCLVISNPRGYFPHEWRSRHFAAWAEDIEFADLLKDRLP